MLAAEETCKNRELPPPQQKGRYPSHTADRVASFSPLSDIPPPVYFPQQNHRTCVHRDPLCSVVQPRTMKRSDTIANGAETGSQPPPEPSAVPPSLRLIATESTGALKPPCPARHKAHGRRSFTVDFYRTRSLPPCFVTRTHARTLSGLARADNGRGE